MRASRLRRRRLWLGAPLSLAALLIGSTVPADATYPGANGEIVYYDFEFRAVEPDGSNDRTFISIHFPQTLSLSSDGSQAIVSNYGKLYARIVLVDLVAHTRTPVLRTGDTPTGEVDSVALSPDGSHVAFCDEGPNAYLWTVAIDGTGLSKIAKGYCFADWSVDGRIVASKERPDGDRIITTMDPEGGNRRVIVILPPRKRRWYPFDLRPSWSPDGGAVVFGAQRNRSRPEIWWVDSDGSNLHKLTHTTLSEYAPVFSPDGLRIVYARRFRLFNELWIMDSDGANQAQLLVRPDGSEYPLAWRAT
jgi:Tol biopolymer transport system component